jgi:hypothetical protein
MTDYKNEQITFYAVSTDSLTFDRFKEEFMDDCFTDDDIMKVWTKMVDNFKKHLKVDKIGYDVEEHGSLELDDDLSEDKIQELRDKTIKALGVKQIETE